jgi:hypothetical protein
MVAGRLARCHLVINRSQLNWGVRRTSTPSNEMRNSLRVVLCVLLVAPLAAEAQQLDSLRSGILAHEVGSEVRVSTPSAGRIQGRLLEVTPDTLRIGQATGPRTVSFSNRDTLWIREPLGWTAAGYGAVAGLASAGGILLFFSSMCGSGDDPCTGFGHAALVLGTGGVVLGGAVGLVAGELINHWVKKTP